MAPVSFEWIHTALVYYGPTEGISVYFNGSLVDSNFVGSSVSHEESTGIFFLGKEYSARDENYAEVIVDELYFWNQPLGAAVIQQLYNLY